MQPTQEENQPVHDQTDQQQITEVSDTHQLARRVGRLRQVQDLTITMIILCVFTGLAVWFALFYFPANEFPWFLYIPLPVMVLIPLGAVFQRIKIMRNRDPRTMEPTIDQPFAGTDNLRTVTAQMNEFTVPHGEKKASNPYPRAQVGNNAEIITWFGPADRIDQKGLSRDIGLAEHISPENTLLFTREQMIAMTLTQEDFDALGGNKPMDHLAAWASVRREAEDQKMSVTTFNLNKWPDAVKRIHQAGLDTILASHYNYGIPYGDIIQIETKRRFVNPGIYIHLRDGTILKFATFSKDAVDKFVQNAQPLGLNIS